MSKDDQSQQYRSLEDNLPPNPHEEAFAYSKGLKTYIESKSNSIKTGNSQLEKRYNDFVKSCNMHLQEEEKLRQQIVQYIISLNETP